MSLSIDALRWLTVRALNGATWAGANVFDSPATVADLRIAAQRQPFIAVYCDEADTDGVDDPWIAGPMTVRLVIECGVASAVTISSAGATGPDPLTTTVLNDTDPAMEATIGFLSEQARDALLDTSNPWAELWRMLTGAKVTGVQYVRGGPPVDQAKPSQRYASRIMILHVGVLAVPPRGDVLMAGTFWPMFLAAAAADPELSGIASIVLSHLTYPSGTLPDWRIAQKYLGVTAEVVAALGIAPEPGGFMVVKGTMAAVESADVGDDDAPTAPIDQIMFSELWGDVPQVPPDHVDPYPSWHGVTGVDE